MSSALERQRSNEQIASALLEVDRLVRAGRPLPKALAEVGVPRTTYYRWRRRFEGLTSGGVARIRDLSRENTRLRRIVADKVLEIEMLRELSRGTS
jgi:putative transposase